MRRINNWIKFGILFNSIWLIANHYLSTPHFLSGMLAGFGMILIIIGISKETRNLAIKKS